MKAGLVAAAYDEVGEAASVSAWTARKQADRQRAYAELAPPEPQ